MMRQRVPFLLLVIACWLASTVAGAAQTYPDRVIKLIVAYPAGGPVDVMARFLGQRLAPNLGPLIIDNRAGGGGLVGTKAAAAADPDGYTLLFGGPTTLAAAPMLFKNPGYDPVKNFTPVAMIASVPFVIAVSPKVPVTTLQELVAYAKANPGKLNYGAPAATMAQLTAELFKLTAGVDIVDVPYKSGATALADILSGQMDVAFEPTSLMLGQLKAGKLRSLAITSTTRNPELPDVPTVIECGYPDYTAGTWSGIVAPAGTPAAIVSRLNSAINKTILAPETKANLAKLGAEPMTGSPEEFAKFLAEETRKWTTVIQKSGIKFD
jgi:tripartite-type tricarboxylate transporter receptor subunit TctC